MLETASIAGGAVAALFLALVLGFFAYVRWHQTKKREQLEELYHNTIQQQSMPYTNGHEGYVNGAGASELDDSVDIVDGSSNGDRICYSQEQQQFSNLTSSNSNNNQIKSSYSQQQQQIRMVHHQPLQQAARIHQSFNARPTNPAKRPFGPHHCHSITMGDAIMRDARN